VTKQSASRRKPAASSNRTRRTPRRTRFAPRADADASVAAGAISHAMAGLDVLHDTVPGRVRFRCEAIIDRPARAQAVTAALADLAGVAKASASALTGSVLVAFAPPATSASLATAVAAAARGARANGRVSANGASGGAASAPRSAIRDRQPVRVDAGVAPHAGPAWHSLPLQQAISRLAANRISGLADAEAAFRLRKFGPNELPRSEPRSAGAIFREQLTTLPIALLDASALVSLLTGGLADAIAIAGVVLLNAGIATATERQAERTILGLASYAPHPVRVIRDGRRHEVLPAALVRGDLIELEPGTLVPADARLVAADDLTVNEAALTGEALPVHKDATVRLRPEVPLGDRVNFVFRGTAVTGGRGLAIVTATGAETEIGQIQGLLGSVRPPETPIQRQLGEVGRELVIANGLICAGVLALGLLRGQGLVPMLRSAIALAVAAIPEGLPAVATTTLALGVQDMRRRNVLVRKIEAVETLGAVQVVGLDKTGTLTENRMAAVAIHVGGERYALDGGRMTRDGQPADGAARDLAARMFEAASLCSDATLGKANGGTIVGGTPTETALVQAALDLGVDVAAARRAAPVLATVPRTLGRKRMSTLHGAGRARVLYVKGDPVEVLERCSHVLGREGRLPIDAAARSEILKANQRMAGKALRVLGMAFRPGAGGARSDKGLTWLGLAGLANPIRAGSVRAIKTLHGAGIRTVMITGDQSATAFAIARELDLGDGGEIRVLEAGQVKGVDPKVLAAIAANPHVFARVSPVDKLEIVRALQADGRIVAMTGDGINDGPALKAADVGVAMGAGGTDVAREVADIVLATDDLDGVVEAVRLGRATYANIRKVLRFLVSTNSAETMVMLGAAIAGWPEPLKPMQLLWLNLVTDVLPGLALGLEPPEPDVLAEPPHDPRAPILAPRDFRRLLVEGSVLGGATLAAFLAEGGARGPHQAAPTPSPSRASTVAFHGLTLSQLAHAVVCRSEHHGILEELRRPPNRKLYAALAACLAMQAGAQLAPFTRRLLGLTPLAASDLAAILAVGLGSVAANEAIGAIIRGARHARIPTARNTS
jgi:Ca2+-transporting ATPase